MRLKQWSEWTFSYLLTINQSRWFPCFRSSRWLPFISRIKSDSLNNLHGLISACFFSLPHGWPQDAIALLATFWLLSTPRALSDSRLLLGCSSCLQHSSSVSSHGCFSPFRSRFCCCPRASSRLPVTQLLPSTLSHFFFFFHCTYLHLKLFISSLPLPN